MAVATETEVLSSPRELPTASDTMTVTGNAAHVSWQMCHRQPTSPRPKFGPAALVCLWSDSVQAQKMSPEVTGVYIQAYYQDNLVPTVFP